MFCRRRDTKYTLFLKSSFLWPAKFRIQSNSFYFLKLLKARVGGNIVGFHISSQRDAKYMLMSNPTIRIPSKPGLDRDSVIDTVIKSLRKDRYAILNCSGYDEYYLLRSDALDTASEEFTLQDNSTVKSIAKKYTKYASTKRTNRIILNRFIGMIA